MERIIDCRSGVRAMFKRPGIMLFTLIACCIALLPVQAQDDVPTLPIVTPSGFKIDYPVTYTATIVNNDTIVLSGLVDGNPITITIQGGETARRQLTTSLDIQQAFDQVLEARLARYDVEERENFLLTNAPIVLQRIGTFTGNGYIAALRGGGLTESGLFEHYALLELRSPTATNRVIQRQRDMFIRLANSVEWTADPARFATPVPRPLPRVSLPAGALTAGQMPEGTIVFTTGIQFTIDAEYWEVESPDTPIADSATLRSRVDDARIFIATSDLALLPSVEAWRTQLLQFNRSLLGISREVTAPRGEMLTIPVAQPGTTVEYFRGGDFGLSLYFINFDRQAAAMLQVNAPGAGFERRADIETEVERMLVTFRRVQRVSATPTPGG
jgi:hypothetical protein